MTRNWNAAFSLTTATKKYKPTTAVVLFLACPVKNKKKYK
jgi:hypothetical protein